MHYKLENLNNKTGKNFIQAFAAIPKNVTSLTLRFNGLGNKTAAELAQAFAAIPTGVTALDLAMNSLGNKTATELAEAFAAIPAGVTTLDLGWNDLDKKTPAELALVFAAIPSRVATLDLRNNHFDCKTGAELTKILQAMPVNIKSVAIRCGSENINPHMYAIIAPLVEKINNEIARLQASKSSKGSFLVNIGILEASNEKITALQELGTILINGAVAGKDPDEFHNELRQWKVINEACIAKQRNCLHSFFSPSHKPTAACAVDDIFAALDIPEIALNTSEATL